MVRREQPELLYNEVHHTEQYGRVSQDVVACWPPLVRKILVNILCLLISCNNYVSSENIKFEIYYYSVKYIDLGLTGVSTPQPFLSSWFVSFFGQPFVKNILQS